MNARIEFLERRRSGIGGSDISAIVGLNPWKTPLQVWQSKVELQEDSTSEAAYWGTVLEDVVAKEYARRTGHKVQRVTTQMRHPEHPFAIANIDRAVVNTDIAGRVFWRDGRLTTNRLLECKTANGFAAKQWGEEGSDYVPDQYLVQCQWYMGITGAEFCDLAVLIGGQDFRTYSIAFDPALFADLLQAAADFWQLVENRIEPDPANYAEAVSKWSKSDPAKIIEAGEELADALDKLQDIKAQAKQIEKQEDQVKNQILMAMQEAETMIYQGVRVATCKTQTRTSFDSKTFEKDHPDLFAQYRKTSSTRVLRVL